MSGMLERKPLRVLVVDDEPAGATRLLRLLELEPDVELVGSAEHGEEAIGAIRRLQPDLVFLDIHMPGKSGLDVVREIGPEAMPATIFVTAYDQYALRAFDLAAVDYLVKPYDDERFEQAFRRARRAVELEGRDRVLDKLLAVLQGADPSFAAPQSIPAARTSPSESAKYLERIAVQARGKITVVPVTEIDFILASGPYVEIHAGARKHLIRESMQSLEDQLDPEAFLRIHRSAIARIELITTLLRSPTGDYEVVLKDGVRLRVGRSRRELVQRRLGG